MTATLLTAAIPVAGQTLVSRLVGTTEVDGPGAPGPGNGGVLGAACKGLENAHAMEATVAVTLKGGLGYQPNCAVIDSGGVVEIVNVDNAFHNPANDPVPGSENRGQCFNYAAENGGGKLYAGGTYTLQFRITEDDELQVKSVWSNGDWQPCEPSDVRANGDRVIDFGCTDHWTIARGTIIVHPPVGL